MKCVLLYFFLLIALIHKNDGQTFCPGLRINFNLTGEYCGVSGNINLFHNSSAISIFAGFSNLTTDNFNRDLCATLNSALVVSASSNQCLSFDPNSVSGNFNVSLALCDVSNEIFQDFTITYNENGLQSDKAACDDTFNCRSTSTTPTITTLLSTSLVVTSLMTASTLSSMSSTQTSTPATGPYYPCQVLVTTLVDISNTLNIDYFQKQLSFTKTFLSQINHPERIRYGGYLQTNGNMTYPWNDTNTQEGLQQAIDNTHQQSQTSSLSGAMRVLISNPDTNRTVPDSTIIFVTDTTNSVQIQSAVNLYNSALKGRVKITFILAANKTDAAALQGFDDAIFFYWQNMNTSQPDGWDTSQALRCTLVSSTTAASTATTNVTRFLSTSAQSTASTLLPYIPCQSWISFSYDDSSTLQNNEFETQLAFISSAIGAMNYPNRLRANGAFTSVVSWNSDLTVSQIQTELYITQQTANTYSLLQEFSNLLTDYEALGNTNWPIGALIFISNTSDAALAGADVVFRQLNNVKLTFVLLGQNVDSTKLTNFSSNFIYWTNLSKPQPDNWNSSLAGPAYGCSSKRFALTTNYNNSFTTISVSKMFMQKLNKAVPINKLSIDDYCISSPTSSTGILTTSSLSSISSTANPNEITPPLPIIDCSDPNNSYIIKQTCLINDTSNSTTIDQLINTTSTHIQDKINNDNFTAENLHDTGIFMFTTVTTVDNLTTDGAHNFLDITNSVVDQSLDILTAANNITPNTLLWYPSSLPKVVAKTEKDLNYSKPDSNILVHSFSLNNSFCDDSDKNSHQICYSSTSQVPSGSKDAEFCTTFNPKVLCKNGNILLEEHKQMYVASQRLL